MRKLIINTNKAQHTFKFYDGIWISTLQVNGKEIEFEIYKETFDELLVSDILGFIESDNFDKVKYQSVKLLTQLSLSFWGYNYQDSIFHLQGISIGMDVDEEIADFQCIYHMSSIQNDFEDFANWKVDIENYKVIGVRREQI